MTKLPASPSLIWAEQDPAPSTIWCLHIWTLDNSSSGKLEAQGIMSQEFLRFSETLCHPSLQSMVTCVQQHVKDSAFDQLRRWSLKSLLRSLPGLVEGAPIPLSFQHLLPLKPTTWSTVITAFCLMASCFISPLQVPKKWDPTIYSSVSMPGMQRCSVRMGMAVWKGLQLWGQGRGKANAYLKAYFLYWL